MDATDFMECARFSRVDVLEDLMATAEPEQTEITISSDALGLLDCFSTGFDDLLCRIAEHVARERAQQPGEVEITVQDIQAAGDIFAKTIKRSDLPEDVKQEADAMLSCLSERLKLCK